MHEFKKSLELVSKHRLLVPLSKPEIIQRQLYSECIHVPMFRGHFLFELFIRKICSCRCGVWSCKSWLVHHGMVKLQEEIIEIRRRYDRNYRRYIYFWCPIFLGILDSNSDMTSRTRVLNDIFRWNPHLVCSRLRFMCGLWWPQSEGGYLHMQHSILFVTGWYG